MSYIIKNTQALINTKLTDAGRRKLSQGNFNIKYFQVGDSEIMYNDISGYTYTDCNILSPQNNSQNITFQPNTNKGNVKYPYFVKGSSGNTYGIPIDESNVTSVYNTAAPRGFFTDATLNNTTAYTKNSQYIVDICGNCDTDTISLTPTSCGDPNTAIQIGDFLTIYYDGSGACSQINATYPVLTYRVRNVAGNSVQLDRPIIKCCDGGCPASGKTYIYPSGMTQLYDTIVPVINPQLNNFDSLCAYSDVDVPVWNMNIPWKVNPAGLNPSVNEDYGKFGSVHYIGTMEYLGYGSSLGQSFYVSASNPNEETDTFFRNSYDEVVKVLPEEQKAIAVVHYTNNSIDTMYGEKFAMNPFDPAAVTTEGFARNFEVVIPWLMWHKNPNGTIGETFYVDPAVGTEDYFQVKYMQSKKNTDMNDPGLRYFHLWDTYIKNNGTEPNRVGKVFPDLKIIVFDDEEIVAALSYKSNRNWTLPAPKISLVPPQSSTGILLNENEYLWVTYRFNSDTTSTFTSSLHSNYYLKIQGPQSCYTTQSQDVAVKFGDIDEFSFLKDCCNNGYQADEFYLLAQKVSGATTQPDPSDWILISTAIGPAIQASDMINNTFYITDANYASGSIYDLGPILSLPAPTGEEDKMNFGDEYYFYGTIKTDIQATIYEMKYLINLASSTFNFTQNPSWVSGDTYVTEVGFYDSEKDLMVTSKLQSPFKRQGTQQISISLDF